jgi:4-hydroxy-2-oxoheptanedioate aldolase
VRDAIADIERAASAAGLVSGIHAGDGKVGHAMAQLGFQMITLASESQALRRGAAAGLQEATAQDPPTGGSPAGGYQ